MATVSVIIPTHGRIDQPLNAVASVIGQRSNKVGLEVLLVSDNERDGAVHSRLARAIAADWPQVNLLLNDRISGACGARNTGIIAAKGQYVAFLDDDDFWLPNKLVLQMDAFDVATEKVGLIDTGFLARTLSRDGGVSSREVYPWEGDLTSENLLTKREISRAPKLSTVMVKAQVFEKVGLFDEALPSRQDLDFYLRLTEFYKIKSIPRILAVSCKTSSDRISSNYKKKSDGFRLFFRKYHHRLAKRPEDWRYFWRHYCAMALKYNHYSRAGYCLIRSFLRI